MADYTKEQIDSMPDAFKADFVEVKEGDKSVYRHTDFIAANEIANASATKLTALEAQLSEDKAKVATETAAAVEAAREAALKEAQKTNNWEEQERLLREKFEDEKARFGDETRQTVTKELSMQAASKSLDSEIKLAASKLAKNDGAAIALEMIMKNHVKLNEEGKQEFFGADMKAISVNNFDKFTKEFADFDSVGELVKGELTTKGAGQSKKPEGTGIKKNSTTSNYLNNLR